MSDPIDGSSGPNEDIRRLGGFSVIVAALDGLEERREWHGAGERIENSRVCRSTRPPQADRRVELATAVSGVGKW